MSPILSSIYHRWASARSRSPKPQLRLLIHPETLMDLKRELDPLMGWEVFGNLDHGPQVLGMPLIEDRYTESWEVVEVVK